MLFNTDKSKVLHFGYNNPQTEYTVDGVKLQSVKEGNDLRIIVSIKTIYLLKWERQYIEAVKKANKMLGLIKRNFHDKSKGIIIPLYKSLVRPHLEYCCQVWSPYFNEGSNLIEGVQRRAAKMIKRYKTFVLRREIGKLGIVQAHYDES